MENAVFASQCEHDGLHVSSDATIVEILRPDGSPCPPGEDGEVVGTNLFRHTAATDPFSARRQGPLDRATLSLRAVAARHRGSPSAASRTSLSAPTAARWFASTASSSTSSACAKEQIVQKSRNRILVRIARGSDYDPANDGTVS